MGDTRIRLSPVRVVGVVHGLPVVDWRHHRLNIRFLAFLSEISSLTIETQHCPDIEETSVAYYLAFIIHVCFV